MYSCTVNLLNKYTSKEFVIPTIQKSRKLEKFVFTKASKEFWSQHYRKSQDEVNVLSVNYFSDILNMLIFYD